MTTVRLCTVEPSAIFFTRINGMATLEQLQHAIEDMSENLDFYDITPDVWDVEAKLLDDGHGAYFGNVRLLTKRAADDGDASVKKYARGANDEVLDVSVHG